MMKLNFGGKIIEVFDTIFEMPPHRENKMNLYLLSDLGIGSSFEAIDSHLSGIQMQAWNGTPEALAQEIENLKLSYFSILSSYSPDHMAWMCLISSIDGEPFTDLSEENLMKTGRELSESVDVEYKWREIFEIIKKKFLTSSQITSLSGSLETEA